MSRRVKPWGRLVCDAVIAGTSADAVRTAISALIGSLKDPKPDVRIAAARGLGVA